MTYKLIKTIIYLPFIYAQNIKTNDNKIYYDLHVLCVVNFRVFLVRHVFQANYVCRWANNWKLLGL